MDNPCSFSMQGCIKSDIIFRSGTVFVPFSLWSLLHIWRGPVCFFICSDTFWVQYVVQHCSKHKQPELKLCCGIQKIFYNWHVICLSWKSKVQWCSAFKPFIFNYTENQTQIRLYRQTTFPHCDKITPSAGGERDDVTFTATLQTKYTSILVKRKACRSGDDELFLVTSWIHRLLYLLSKTTFLSV